MIKTITQTIAAGGSIRVPSGMRSFYVKKAVSPISITMREDRGTGQGVAEDIKSGFFYRGAAPVSLEISSALEQEVTLLVSDGEIGTNEADFSAVTIQTDHPTSVETLPDKSCPSGARTLVYSGSPDGREIIVSNTTGETLRIGDINTAADRGAVLDAFGTLILTTGGALYVWNTGAGAANVAITATKK